MDPYFFSLEMIIGNWVALHDPLAFEEHRARSFWDWLVDGLDNEENQ